MDTQTTPQPDLQALALTKAIRQQESGGNYSASGDAGTSTGAYQYQPATWANYAQQVLGDSKAPMTEANQNAVTYGMIKTWKDSGMGPAEVAAKWNHGSSTGWENLQGSKVINGQTINYDTPTYVKNVVSNFQQLYPQVQQQFGTQQPTQDNQPWSVGGFVQNAVGSVGNLAGGLFNAAIHPIDTATNLLSTAAGGIEKGTNALGLTNINNQDTQNFGNLVNYFGKKYGGSNPQEIASNIISSVYHDPASVALDLSTLLDGVGGALGVAGKAADIGELANVGSKISDVGSAINPIVQGGKALSVVGKPLIEGAGSLIKSGISHATGFDTQTISNIISDPAAFSKASMDEISRGGVLEDVQSGLQNLQKSYAETGAEYAKVLGATKSVALPENFLEDILNKGTVTENGKAIPLGYNLVQKDGKYVVEAGTDAKMYDPRSVSAIQQFVDRWGGKTDLTPQEFMNMRQEAAKLGKLGREVGQNKAAATVGKQIQGELNRAVRPQIKGLAEVDAASAPQINLINKVKKDLYNADGTLKDNAASKVANALNKNGLMQRLEQVTPGITHKLEILKSVEDIERSMGIKVGNYARSAGEIFSVGTGNIPMLVGMIISHPTVATQLLKGFGYTGKAAIPILGRVRALLGALPRDVMNVGVINNQAISNPSGSTMPPVSMKQ